MRFFPEGELLRTLEAQGLKTPEIGYLVSEPELAQVTKNLRQQLPSEDLAVLTVRALYFLIWRDYSNAETAATGDGADAIDSRRIQSVHEGQKALLEEQMPALAKSLGWMTKEIAKRVDDTHSEACAKSEQQADRLAGKVHEGIHATQGMLIASAEAIEAKVEQARTEGGERDRVMLGVLEESGLAQRDLHDETARRVDEARHFILCQMGELHAQIRNSFIEQEEKVKKAIVRGLGVAFLLFLALLGAVVAGHCQTGLDGVRILDEGVTIRQTMGGIAQLDFAGAGVSCSYSAPKTTCTIAGGGGAPIAAEYLVLSNHATLTGERQFVAGAGVAGTDAGADSTYTLAIDLLDSQDGGGAAFSFSGLEFQGGSTDELALLQGCADTQILKWDDDVGGNGRWDCANDETGAGGGDAITVNTAAVVDPDFIDSTTISVDENLVPAPDTISWSVRADTITGTQVDETAEFNYSNVANDYTGATYTGPTADPADSGIFRGSNAEALLCAEAAPAGTDVCLTVDASEIIQVSGGTIDAADLSGIVPDASINGANEAEEIDIDNLAGLTAIGSALTATNATNSFTGATFIGPTADPADSGIFRASNAEKALCWEAAPAGTDVCLEVDASEIIQVTGGTFDAADLSGIVPDASVDGSAEAGEIDIDNLAGIATAGSVFGFTNATNAFTGATFTGPTADPADSGVFRGSNAEALLCAEAAPAGTDVCLTVDASEVIQISGGTLDAAYLSGVVPDASVDGSAEAGEIDIDNLAGLTAIASAFTFTNGANVLIGATLTDGSADPADARFIRMGNNVGFGWELATPGTDKYLIVNTSDQLETNADIVGTNALGYGYLRLGLPGSATAASYLDVIGGDLAANGEAGCVRLVPSPEASGDDSWICASSTGGRMALSSAQPGADPAATTLIVTAASTDTLTNKTLAAADNIVEADTGDGFPSFFPSFTSSDLRTALSDEIGTGFAMFGLISTMADDLSCTGSQVVRRNAGDTAFECATLSGGTAYWETMTNNADTATSFTGSADAETVTFDFQSAFATDRFIIKSSTGNPTAGDLVSIESHDANVTPLRVTGSGGQSITISPAAGDMIFTNSDTNGGFQFIPNGTGDYTFGVAQAFTMTFNAGATDPTFGFDSDDFTATAGNISLVGHVGVADSGPAADRAFNASETYANPAAAVYGLVLSATANETAAPNANTVIGFAANSAIGATNTQNWTGASYGVIGASASANVNTGATGTIGLAQSYVADAVIAAGTVTSRIGYHVRNSTGAGTVTNQYGVYVDDLTDGASTNYAFYSAGTNQARFGGVVNAITGFQVNGAAPNTNVLIGNGTNFVAGQVGDTMIADGAVDGGTGGEIADGTITSADLATANKTGMKSMVVLTPATGLSNFSQMYFGAAITITRVACSIDAGTSATIQLDERAEATPNTAGTNVMTSALVCDTDSQTTTSFTNATIAARVPLNLQITGTSGSIGALRVHVEYTID